MMVRRRGRWRAAEYPGEFPSLGWGLRDLYEAHLRVPAGPHYGEPLTLTDEQVAFLVRFYRLHPISGARVYRRGVLRRMKGWGKSPFMAAIAIGELVGDVVFDGWSADGEPVGRPRDHPWVQLAAVAEDQTDNAYVPLHAMLAESPAIDEFRIDLGITRVYLRDRPGRIEPVTSESGTREGQPITCALMDQTEVWVPSNGGVRLADTLRRNAAKANCQTIETPNAHIPGDGSVAEGSFIASTKAQRGLLYDNLEAPDVPDLSNREDLLNGLRFARGDSHWVPIERLADEAADADTKAGDVRRFYLNQAQAPEEAVVDIEAWRRLRVVGPLEPGVQVCLGFDGSENRDATALVAIRYPDMVAFPLGVWEKPEGAGPGWEVSRPEVHAVVDRAFKQYRVARFYFDPPRWRDAGDAWAEEYGKDRVAKFETAQLVRMSAACDRFDAVVVTGQLRHNGDVVFERHLANGRRSPTRHGWVMVRKSQGHPTDAATALIVGLAAYGDAMTAGELVPTGAPSVVGDFDQDAYEAEMARIMEDEARVMADFSGS